LKFIYKEQKNATLYKTFLRNKSNPSAPVNQSDRLFTSKPLNSLKKE